MLRKKGLSLLVSLLVLVSLLLFSYPVLASPEGVDIRQNGEITISGSLQEGGRVYIDIPIKNFGNRTSPAIHTYTEGYTGAGALWRADNASPTAVELSPGETKTIRLWHDLWYDHDGGWTVEGVYLWNDDSDTYYGPLDANGHEQYLLFYVSRAPDLRQSSGVQVFGSLSEGNTVYLYVELTNYGPVPTLPLHPYFEGYTGAGALWRADSADPDSRVIQVGETVRFQTSHALWYDHTGTWNTYGIYLWNDEADSYIGQLNSDGRSQHVEFSVRDAVTPFMDVPFSYSRDFTDVVKDEDLGGYASANFDHMYPSYDAPPNLDNPHVVDFLGSDSRYPSPYRPAYNGHSGVDFKLVKGTPILAAAEGTIADFGYVSYKGNFVAVQHPNGYRTEYWHLSGFADGLYIGQKVSRDASHPIAYSGDSGSPGSYHLHLQVYAPGDLVVDSFGWMPVEGSEWFGERDPWGEYKNTSWTENYLWVHEFELSQLANYTQNSLMYSPSEAISVQLDAYSYGSPLGVTVSEGLLDTSLSGNTLAVATISGITEGNNSVAALEKPMKVSFDLSGAGTESAQSMLSTHIPLVYRWDGSTWVLVESSWNPTNSTVQLQSYELGTFAVIVRASNTVYLPLVTK